MAGTNLNLHGVNRRAMISIRTLKLNLNGRLFSQQIAVGRTVVGRIAVGRIVVGRMTVGRMPYVDDCR